MTKTEKVKKTVFLLVQMHFRALNLTGAAVAAKREGVDRESIGIVQANGGYMMFRL